MNIPVMYLIGWMWILMWVLIAFIIFLYERIAKLKFYMWMNVWKQKYVSELKSKFRE